MRKALLLTVLLGWLSVCACCTTPQPTVEYPPLDQLLIDESDFPEGWEATEPNWEHPPGAPWSGPARMVEYIDRGFYTRSGDGAAASMAIRQFDSLRAAAREYEHEVEVTFRDEEWNTSWAVPDGLQLEDLGADRYHYGCSEVFGQSRCAYVAQYGVYAVDFDISLYDTNVITYTDLLPVFQVIDERMTLALESEQ